MDRALKNSLTVQNSSSSCKASCEAQKNSKNLKIIEKIRSSLISMQKQKILRISRTSLLPTHYVRIRYVRIEKEREVKLKGELSFGS